MSQSQNNIELLLPEQRSEDAVQTKIADGLRRMHSIGKYQGRTVTNHILNDLVGLYSRELDDELKEIASAELMEITLSEFSKCKYLEDKESETFVASGMIEKNLVGLRLYTRAHKYLAERCAALNIEKPHCTDSSEFQRRFDSALICAREIVQLSGLSDQIRNEVFINHLEIRIPPAPQKVRIDADLSAFERFESRVALNNRESARIFPNGTFELDMSYFESVLDPVMTQNLGYSFTNICDVLVALSEHTPPDLDSFNDVNFLDFDAAVSYLCGGFPEITKRDIERIIGGFTISSAGLQSPNRTYYNPQEEHRALGRCFFELTMNGRPHLVWVHELFFDAFNLMRRKISHGALPKEWKDPKLAEALGKINNARGTWFEQNVLEQTKLLGLLGMRSKKELNSGGTQVPIVPGELDYIGWSPRDSAFIFLEAKMLEWAGEPKAVKQQIDKFERPKGFKDKYLKKCEWIVQNSSAVVSELQSAGIQAAAPTNLKTAFITYEPSAAASRLHEFPCVSLAEFVHDFEREGKWPYSIGVFDLP
ncbi:MAG: hypothetical protein J0M35_01810 [Candidatus Obscuribacter phosphatis]|uniref:Uncharacterized protein n=1 Tax=Candidatus Obscuribacter phosphatis TaxID=1906157 RepID=A0A8J7P6H3_9BACT|nr:hypothetical protein [Candidatus Obscuribacter phosphatis]